MHIYPARALERAMRAKEVITRALSCEMSGSRSFTTTGLERSRCRGGRCALAYPT